jgi:histidyl-tRNA synthetase
MLDSIILQTNNEKLYAPIIDEWLENDIFNLSKTLRSQGKNIVTWLEVQKFGKAIQYADKQWFDAIVILGENEKKEWIYKIKNLKTWEEKEFKL